MNKYKTLPVGMRSLSFDTDLWHAARPAAGRGGGGGGGARGGGGGGGVPAAVRGP